MFFEIGRMGMSDYHESVMATEVVDCLTRGGLRGGLFVDATLGGGGHSEALLRCRPDARVIGVDQDPEAIEAASQRLKVFGDRFRAIHGNFRGIDQALGEEKAMGVVMDLGVSSRQLDSVERGFSFQRDGPLDMRMDPANSLTAARVVNEWREEELGKIFWEWGEERFSRQIASAVVEARKHRVIRTTGELAELVVRLVLCFVL